MINPPPQQTSADRAVVVFNREKKAFRFTDHKEACKAVGAVSSVIMDHLIPLTHLRDPGSWVLQHDHASGSLGPISISLTAVQRLIVIDISMDRGPVDGVIERTAVCTRLAADLETALRIVAGAMAQFAKEEK